MKKEKWAFFAVTAVILALGLIAFRPSGKKATTIENPTCCSKKMKNCTESTPSRSRPNDFRPESLSQQFISIFPSTY